KGEDGYDRVDGHASRGNAAFVLQPGPEGELVVLKHGPRTMPVLYTHLIPATFGGRARMNVANALAAAAAAWAAGAHLHDIRQGLRTFSTSFFQAPGRLNLVELGGGARAGIERARAAGGARTTAAEAILLEMDAVRAALGRARAGDLVVMCVDDAVGVYRETIAAAGGVGGGTAFTDPGELVAPEG